MAKGKAWTHDELLVAMNLYCKLSFGHFHKKHPLVIEVSEAMGRTPSSVSMKLCNLASLDPYHEARGVSGLKGASRGDRIVWDEFNSDWEKMALVSESKFSELLADSENIDMAEQSSMQQQSELLDHKGPLFKNENTESSSLVKVRIGQRFFRQSVLSSYNSCCCVTGNPVPELLVASHIVPWCKYPEHRLNPRNGLCLARTQDAAFDKGLVTFDDNFRLVISKYLKEYFPNDALNRDFLNYEGVKINMPEKFSPDPLLMEKHREEMFVE